MRDFSKTVETILRQWDAGNLGAGEFRFRLLQTITPATLAAFLKVVPPDVVEQLRAESDTAPNTEEQWTRFRFYPEQDKAFYGKYREGIETLRQWYREAD